jgi:hypothetical protein
MQCSSASNRIYKLVMKESELRREKKQKAGRAAGKIRGFKQCLFWKSCAGRPKPEASGLRPAEAEAAAELLLTFSKSWRTSQNNRGLRKVESLQMMGTA